MMQEPVEYGGRECGIVVEDRGPVLVDLVGRDDDRPALIAIAENLKEQIEQSVKDSGRMSNVFGGLFITLIVYPIFTILGALLGYALFRPKTPPQTTQA